MENLERLASFYLGQEYDLAQGEMLDQAVHYDARDLTTHAVCLGMTGSGKTGLGVILLEEAALDGVPSLVIDPKGDMTNLLLTFPDLRPEDFRPWVNPDDARRKDMDLDDLCRPRWPTCGATGWRAPGQGPDRIRRLKEAADFAIYTPGSSAGRQVSILHTLKAPDAVVGHRQRAAPRQDRERRLGPAGAGRHRGRSGAQPGAHPAVQHL